MQVDGCQGFENTFSTFFPFCFTEVVKEKEMGGVEMDGWRNAKICTVGLQKLPALLLVRP